MGSMFTKFQTIPVSSASQTNLIDNHSKCSSDITGVLQTYEATLLNCQLRAVCKGKLEIGSSALVFSDGRFELVWPLCSLRWYGRDSRHFVFESGHRSPYGRGLLFFKCKNPKRLTRCVDERINSILQQSEVRDSLNSSDIHSPTTAHRHTQPSLVKLVFHIAPGKHCPGENRTACCSQEVVTNEISCSLDQNCASHLSTSITPAASTTSLLQSAPMFEDMATGPNSQSPHESVETSQHGTQSNERYLIAAAAPHSYINQPNCRLTATSQDVQWLTSCNDSNDYVPEPS